MKPIIYIFHLYGMGYCVCNRFWITNCALVLINLMSAVYVYFGTYVMVITTATNIYDLSTIMSVVRLHFRFLTPIIMIIYYNFYKTEILNAIKDFDHLVPSVKNISLQPYLLQFIGWISMTLMAEFLQLLIFNMRTNFKYCVSFKLFFLFVFSNIWIITPVLQYIFLIQIILYGIRNINENVMTIQMWKTFRPQWKKLQHVANHLTKSVFGEIIMVFIGLTIMDITFFCFTSYLAWKEERVFEVLTYIIIILVRSSLIIQLFRTCHHCKMEVIIIKIILPI